MQSFNKSRSYAVEEKSGIYRDARMNWIGKAMTENPLLYLSILLSL
jgi:hypothetical protein